MIFITTSFICLIIFIYLNWQTLSELTHRYTHQLTHTCCKNTTICKKLNNFYICSKLLIMLFFNTIFILFMQRINKFNIKQISKNIYSVKFTIGGKIYQLYLEHSKAPSNILQIVDDSDQDVTTQIESIINLKPIIPTIKDLGFKELTIMDSMGDDHTLHENDKLVLS